MSMGMGMNSAPASTESANGHSSASSEMDNNPSHSGTMSTTTAAANTGTMNESGTQGAHTDADHDTLHYLFASIPSHPLVQNGVGLFLATLHLANMIYTWSVDYTLIAPLYYYQASIALLNLLVLLIAACSILRTRFGDGGRVTFPPLIALLAHVALHSWGIYALVDTAKVRSKSSPAVRESLKGPYVLGIFMICVYGLLAWYLLLKLIAESGICTSPSSVCARLRTRRYYQMLRGFADDGQVDAASRRGYGHGFGVVAHRNIYADVHDQDLDDDLELNLDGGQRSSTTLQNQSGRGGSASQGRGARVTEAALGVVNAATSLYNLPLPSTAKSSMFSGSRGTTSSTSTKSSGSRLQDIVDPSLLSDLETYEPQTTPTQVGGGARYQPGYGSQIRKEGSNMAISFNDDELTDFGDSFTQTR